MMMVNSLTTTLNAYLTFVTDILVGFNPMEYTTTEAEGQVSVCVGVVNTNGTRETFSVALLPDEGKQCLIGCNWEITLNVVFKDTLLFSLATQRSGSEVHVQNI